MINGKKGRQPSPQSNLYQSSIGIATVAWECSFAMTGMCQPRRLIPMSRRGNSPSSHCEALRSNLYQSSTGIATVAWECSLAMTTSVARSDGIRAEEQSTESSKACLPTGRQSPETASQKPRSDVCFVKREIFTFFVNRGRVFEDEAISIKVV
jgi:hypothetical protein